MKALSDWQLSRVRNALRAYHRYERDAEGRYCTWLDVREAIAEYTGVEIGGSAKHGAERLRQFVEGIEGKVPGEDRKFPVPKPDALEGITAFLRHEELALLSEEELTEYEPGYQAPLRLIEFLTRDCDSPRTLDASELQGTIRAAGGEKDGVCVRTLTLQRGDDDGLLYAVETREHYATEWIDIAEQWADTGDYRNRTSLVKYGGWAIITPEDSLMLFLKHSANGRNHRYICFDELGLEEESAAEDQAEGMTRRVLRVLEHSYGTDLRGARSATEIAGRLAPDIVVFSWRQVDAGNSAAD